MVFGSTLLHGEPYPDNIGNELWWWIGGGGCVSVKFVLLMVLCKKIKEMVFQ